MRDENEVVPQDIVESAINKGVDYLAQHQYPNGEFCTYVAPDYPMQEWCVTDNVLFNTIVIGSCLQVLSGMPAAEPILSRVAGYLHYQMVHGGVWNFYPIIHQKRRITFYDTESLSYASSFLLERGIQIPEEKNKRLLLDNRARSGLFYSWFVLHPRWHMNKTLWRLWLRGFRTPFNYISMLRRWGEDTSLGLNASILSYIGDIPEAAPVVREIIKVIASGREGNCDRWYQNPFTVYYLVSRAYHRGVKSLEPVAATIIERILATASADGQLGKSVFDTAIGATALMNFGFRSQQLDNAIRFLIKQQQPHGEWPRWIFFYAHMVPFGWGSEELTTAFCLEALARYKPDLGNISEV